MRRLGLPFAVVMGALVTLALLYLMQVLLDDGAPPEDAGVPVRITDAVTLAPPADMRFEAVRPQRIPDPLRPPRLMLREQGRIDIVSTPAPDANTTPATEASAEAASAAPSVDADYLPIVKVAAIYPRRAQAQGITGSCTVEYTITTSGATRDPVAIDCQPAGVFEASSLRAILRFKYRPRMVDGHPVEVRGVRNRFVFELGR